MKYYFSLVAILYLCIFLFAKFSSKDGIESISNFNSSLSSSTNTNLVIISESGCNMCNKKYMKFIMDNAVNRKNTLIYLAASGMILDISPLLSDTIHNIIRDEVNIWKKFNINEGSYFLSIENNKVDTIIRIQPASIEKTLDYISNVSFASLK